MNPSPVATDQARTVVGRFVRVPSEFARYQIDAVAAGRILGVEPDQVEAVAAGVIPHGHSAGHGDLYDYVDVINLALFGSMNRNNIPDLALRFLLRFAASAPATWYKPRQWVVRVRAPESVASDGLSLHKRVALRPVDLDAPGVERLSLDAAAARELATASVEPPGYQVAVRLTGAPGVLRHDHARRIYHELLDALRSGTVIYQSVTEELRMRHRQAWALGMADCVVASRLLAERLREAGLAARARRGYLLGLVGSDHTWCEVYEDDRWKPMDIAFAFLASEQAGTRQIQADPGFAAACAGGRFSRLLPCLADEAVPLIHVDGDPAPPWWTCAVSASSWES